LAPTVLVNIVVNVVINVAVNVRAVDRSKQAILPEFRHSFAVLLLFLSDSFVIA
jgi:hypothetical protein